MNYSLAVYSLYSTIIPYALSKLINIKKKTLSPPIYTIMKQVFYLSVRPRDSYYLYCKNMKRKLS